MPRKPLPKPRRRPPPAGIASVPVMSKDTPPPTPAPQPAPETDEEVAIRKMVEAAYT